MFPHILKSYVIFIFLLKSCNKNEFDTGFKQTFAITLHMLVKCIKKYSERVGNVQNFTLKFGIKIVWL